MFGLRRWLLSIATIVLSSASLLAAEGRESIAFKPPAAWVQVATLDDAQTPASSASTNSKVLLDDHQTRVTDRSIERYARRVRLVSSTKDLQEASQIQIEFEPSYQALTIHHIQIRRGAIVNNALRPGEIRVLHREQELEQQIFNGSVQAIAILNDVRVGDIIDFAYTVTGDNPVMGGKYDELVELDSNIPVKWLRARLLWPQKRKLFMRRHNTNLEPRITPGEETEYVWERRDITPAETEDRVPGWFFSGSWVDVGEFETWTDVIEWALPLYKPDAAASPELAAKIDAIAKASTSPEARLVAALRFVQDEIRYLGIEMGSYSHKPTSPAKVLARRFGDCKDKAILLTTILRALGLDAAPALVNTESGKTLDDRQPSPNAFDHAIVSLRLDGKTYWLDGTQTSQRGGLKQFYNPPFSKALVLRAGVSGLEDIPLTPLAAPTVVSNERYRVSNLNSPVSFTVVTTYTSEAADQMRYSLSRTSLEKVGKQYLNYYADDNPEIRQVCPVKVEDDESTNTLVVTEQYSIPNFWKNSIHKVVADRIAGEVTKPSVSLRSMPLEVKYPLNVLQRIEVEMPDAGDASKNSSSFHDNAIDFEYSEQRFGKTLVLEYSLKTLLDEVLPKDVPTHLATLDNIFNNSAYNVPMNPSRENSDRRDALGFLIVIALGTAVAYAVRRFTKHRRRVLQHRTTSRPGEDPESAITVADGDAMLKHLMRQSCRCGERLNLDTQSLREETLLYDGRRITAFEIHCPSCNSEKDVYFKEDLPLLTNLK
jgi:hypothetical protein